MILVVLFLLLKKKKKLKKIIVETQSLFFYFLKFNQSLSRIFSFQPFKLCASVDQLCKIVHGKLV